MNEETISALTNDLLSHSTDFEFIQAKLLQCYQAIEWAKRSQNLDLVIKIADVCAYDPHDFSMLVRNAEKRGKPLTEEEKKSFCEQVRALVKKGLIAARRLKKQREEREFLATLSHLSAYLDDFEMALDYLKQELSLTPPKSKWVIGQSALDFGRQANSTKNYLAARTFYQFSLDIIRQEETDNKYGEANVLDLMAVNEEEAGNLRLAQELIEKSEKIREHLNKKYL